MSNETLWVAKAVFVANLGQYITGRTESMLRQAASQYHPIVRNLHQEDESGYLYQLSIKFNYQPTSGYINNVFRAIANKRLLGLKLDSISVEKFVPAEASITSSIPLPELDTSDKALIDKVIAELCSQNKIRAGGWNQDGTRLMENLEFSFARSGSRVVLRVKSITSTCRAEITASPIVEPELWNVLTDIFYPER